ncbi:hypothetical protein [Candidatus Parabeggiatoa sp. HSG14]|uniref:hypothetical protein n=1 Tax=Candidatus Parabeggiatoa sp. HSG14 TaxID=3055593 RepID=UPI0025A8498B|nr:hypothetical protein [Thiotrichales bacterium HSG14]
MILCQTTSYYQFALNTPTNIFERTKTVELRRVRPKLLEKGDLVLLYVSSPVQALASAFKVDKIIEKPLKNLWRVVRKKAGITRQEFDNYYDGVSVGVAIFLKFKMSSN